MTIGAPLDARRAAMPSYILMRMGFVACTEVFNSEAYDRYSAVGNGGRADASGDTQNRPIRDG